MATKFTSITQAMKEDFTARYQQLNDVDLLQKLFGEKVAEHHSKKTKFETPFRTLSLSFDLSPNSLQGKVGLGMVIGDFNKIVMPSMMNGANRYRIYLGINEANKRVDILALAFFDSVEDILTDVGIFFEMTSDQIQYDTIVKSAEGWDDARVLDTNEDNKGGYSWHCQPHCPE